MHIGNTGMDYWRQLFEVKIMRHS